MGFVTVPAVSASYQLYTFIRPMKIDVSHVSRPRPHGFYLPHENFSLFIIFEK
jgi:hypothetical protein